VKPFAAVCVLLLAGIGPAAAGAAKPGKRCKHRAHTCAVLKRVKVREPLAERLTSPALSPLPGGGGGGGGSGGGEPAPLPRSVSVSAREFSFTLSRPLVGAGSVSVELRNVGEDPHNLVISPDDGSHSPLASWSDLDPGLRERKSVTLTAGRYRLWCSLPDHEAQGMHADLVVQ
jgi:Copper binding proteins, plastocyanin/azurin family